MQRLAAKATDRLHAVLVFEPEREVWSSGRPHRPCCLHARLVRAASLDTGGTSSPHGLRSAASTKLRIRSTMAPSASSGVEAPAVRPIVQARGRAATHRRARSPSRPSRPTGLWRITVWVTRHCGALDVEGRYVRLGELEQVPRVRGVVPPDDEQQVEGLLEQAPQRVLPLLGRRADRVEGAEPVGESPRRRTALGVRLPRITRRWPGTPPRAWSSGSPCPTRPGAGRGRSPRRSGPRSARGTPPASQCRRVVAADVVGDQAAPRSRSSTTR